MVLQQKKSSACERLSTMTEICETGMEFDCNINKTKLLLMFYQEIDSPVHVVPSPVYPMLQAQVKEPSVFVHIAFVSHRLTKHSLTSKTHERIKLNIAFLYFEKFKLN